MSPAQAAGAPVDRRADICAYGVVLWEMIGGRRLFGGETVVQTLADVLCGAFVFVAPYSLPVPSAQMTMF